MCCIRLTLADTPPPEAKHKKEHGQMAATRRWKNRPQGSNWGDFGPDDQLGRLNLLTPERVRRAAVEIREGRTFCLSLPLDYPGGNKITPRRYPPQIGHTWRGDEPNFNFPLARVDPD